MENNFEIWIPNKGVTEPFVRSSVRKSFGAFLARLQNNFHRAKQTSKQTYFRTEIATQNNRVLDTFDSKSIDGV